MGYGQFQSDHAEIGDMLASHWGMPTNLVEAIMHHHSPVIETYSAARIVNYANHIAKSIDNTGDSKPIEKERVKVQSEFEIKDEEFEAIRIRTRNKLREMLNTK